MTPTQTVLSNDRLYNGKELQDGTNWLDYGARMYYPELGRWMAVDPLPDTGGQESWSTYQYVFNNPAKLTDPDGRFPTPHPSTVLWTSAGFSHNPNEAESYHLGKDLLQRAGKALATVMAMVVPVEEVVLAGAGILAKELGIASKFEISTLKVLKEEKVNSIKHSLTPPTVKEQALEIKKANGNKPNVKVQTVNKVVHYDLDGAAHKGVETPHVQQSLPNTDKEGKIHFNKDRKWVRPMNQQDIRTVRRVLKNRQND